MLLFESLDRDPGIGDDAAVWPLDQHRRGIDIMLVLDLADDLLDQILDRHQPVDAAEFVDHHRDVGAGLPHLHEQIKDRHRRRNEQHLAQQTLQPGGATIGNRPEHVLDVHEADHVVERLAIDRHARVAVLDHAFDDFGERLVDVERDNVDARHHDVCGVTAVPFQDVADQHPLLRGNRAAEFGRCGRDQRIERLALAARPAQQSEKRAYTRKRPGMFRMFRLAVACRRLGIAHQ